MLTDNIDIKNCSDNIVVLYVYDNDEVCYVVVMVNKV